MNNSPAFQFYPKDFLADLDVDDMTPKETGMYIILLCHCWLQKGLKSSSRLVQRYFKSSPTVAAQFYEKDGRFYNTRLDLEEKNQEFRRKKAQEGGLKSAENKRLNKYSSSIVQPEYNTPSSSPSSSSIKNKNHKNDSLPRSRAKSLAPIRLILDESPKRWEGITEEDKALWAKTYPGCNVDQVLAEMLTYWDAQPASKRKLNWKRTIVNRLKWLQDHGGTQTKIDDGREWAIRKTAEMRAKGELDD